MFDFAQVISDVRDIIEQNKKEADNIIREAADIALKKTSEKAPKRKERYTGKRSNRVPGKFARGFEIIKKYMAGFKTYTIENTLEKSLTHLLVDGTKQRQTKSGANRGELQENNFLEDVYAETVSTIEAKYKL